MSTEVKAGQRLAMFHTPQTGRTLAVIVDWLPGGKPVVIHEGRVKLAHRVPGFVGVVTL